MECREQIVQRPGERWMGKDAIAQDGIGDFAQHRHFQDGHNLAALNAQDSSTENLARIAVHHRFHETSGLVHQYRTSDRLHRHRGYSNISTLGPRIRLAQTYASELRVDENSIWYQPFVYAGIPLLEEVCANNAEIVAGDMREGRATLHITYCIDAGHTGLQALIHLDKATLVYLYPGCMRVEPICIGDPPRRHQQVRSGKDTLPCLRLHCQRDGAVSRLFDMHRLCLQ